MCDDEEEENFFCYSQYVKAAQLLRLNVVLLLYFSNFTRMCVCTVCPAYVCILSEILISLSMTSLALEHVSLDSRI